jgi:hypothetical protein
LLLLLCDGGYGMLSAAALPALLGAGAKRTGAVPERVAARWRRKGAAKCPSRLVCAPG